MGFKSITKKDPRKVVKSPGASDNPQLGTTAREAFMSGSNKLAEHLGTHGGAARPGGTQGHGGRD